MKTKTSYLLLFLATIVWGFAFVAQKNASVIPVFSVGAFRSLFATLFLIAVIPIIDKLTKSDRRLIKNGRPDFSATEIVGGVILGVIITVASAFQQYGIERTSASKAAFITALYVVIVPIFASVLGKRPGITSIISIPIAVLGFYLLCINKDESFAIADLLVLICAVIFSVHIIAVDHLSPKCDGVRMSCVQFATAAVLNLAASLIIGETFAPENLVIAIPDLLFLGILSSGVAYTLQIVGQKNTDPTISSLILSLESVFGVIGAALILNERMSPREYIGCGVVFLAILLAQAEPQKIMKALKHGGEKK